MTFDVKCHGFAAIGIVRFRPEITRSWRDGRVGQKGTVPAGTVLGMVLFTPAFTGHSAEIPAGTPIKAYMRRDTPFSCSGERGR